MPPGEDSPLLLVVAVLLSVVAATSSTVALRRMRRGAAFVLGFAVGTASATGLVALAGLAWLGPDATRQLLSHVPSLPRIALPSVTSDHMTVRGVVTHVRDGDTIEVNRVPIRLSGLNCDELGTPLGERARNAMARLVAGQSVACRLDGSRTYDRAAGTCALADGRDLGAVLIEARLCGRCARYDPWRRYAAEQAAAGRFAGSHPAYCWAPW